MARLADFSTMVYENTEKITSTDKIVQPKQTLQLYYEVAIAIVIVPAIMLLVAVLYMKGKKSSYSLPERKRVPSKIGYCQRNKNG